MSSSIRQPLAPPDHVQRGLLIQNNRIVGGLDLPHDREAFVEHFNREYAALGLRVMLPSQSAASLPVAA